MFVALRPLSRVGRLPVTHARGALSRVTGSPYHTAGRLSPYTRAALPCVYRTAHCVVVAPVCATGPPSCGAALYVYRTRHCEALH